ncbi:MAG: nucleotidyltransferase domain-containing protein [Elusimicrobia bacterium]|nr:nucleotidyltransferase domain-containing protein [Elusimicrobiota bacterium]
MTLPAQALDAARMDFESWLNGASPRPPGKDSVERLKAAATALPSGDPVENRPLRIGADILAPETADFARRAGVLRALRSSLGPMVPPDGAAFILHGSFAVGGTTAFSDIDIALLVDEASLDEGRLRRLRTASQSLLRAAYRIDPLMHHGIGVLFRGEMACYDQSILPLNAVESGVVLAGGPLSIEAAWHPGRSRASAASKLRRQIGSLRRDLGTGLLSLYRRKCLLSVLMLLPSLLVESVEGLFPHKRDSFDLARCRFDDNDWRAVERASDMRRRWKVPRLLGRLAAAVHASASPIPPMAGRRMMAAISFMAASRWPGDFLHDASRFLSRCENVLETDA